MILTPRPSQKTVPVRLALVSRDESMSLAMHFLSM